MVGAGAKALHEQWWEQRIARQQAIDASIAAKTEFESLYDKPYTDNRKVRVAGPFHRGECPRRIACSASTKTTS